MSGVRHRCLLFIATWEPRGSIRGVLSIDLPFRPVVGDRIDGLEIVEVDWNTADQSFRLSTKLGAIGPLDEVKSAAMTRAGWILTVTPWREFAEQPGVIAGVSPKGP